MTVISVLFVLLALAYNFMTPAMPAKILHARDGSSMAAPDGGAANADELAHMLYVQTVAGGHLPVFSKTDEDYEAHQPPLYYIAAAAAYKLAPPSPALRVHIVRCVATLLGLALLWIVFTTVRELLPEQEDAAVYAAAIVAMLPMNLALCASVSNDTAINLIFALYLLCMGRLLRQPGRTLKNSLWLGLVIGAGLLTKSSTLILIPLTFIVLGFAGAKNVLPPRSAVLAACQATVAAAVIGMAWFVRNQLLYGDVFAEKVIFHDLAARNHSPAWIIAGMGQNWYTQHFFGWTFDSYWGVFDSMLLFLPTNVYILLAVISLVTIAAGVTVFIKGDYSNIVVTNLFMWAMLTVLAVIAYVQYNAHFFQLQGRYLYPALLPLAAVGAVGINRILPQQLKRWGVFIVTLSLVTLNILCLSMISGHFS
jgi:hypothetical protein